MPREHTDALNRKNIIEKRKEETERREQDKAREEARCSPVKCNAAELPSISAWISVRLLPCLLTCTGTIFY